MSQEGSLALADADELLLSAREPADSAEALSLRLLDAREEGEEDEADEGLLAFLWWLFCWPRWWSLRRHLAEVLPPTPADRRHGSRCTSPSGRSSGLRRTTPTPRPLRSATHYVQGRLVLWTARISPAVTGEVETSSRQYELTRLTP